MHPDYSPIFAMLANEALDKDTSVNIRPPLLSILSIVFVMLVNWGSANADPTSSTVLITGSNRGIGLEFVRQYAARGWRVIATCRRPEAASELQAIAADHDNVMIDRLDITDHHGVDALAEKYSDTPIDVLLNNAALLGSRSDQALDVTNEGILVGLVNPGLVDTRGLGDIGPDDPVPDDFKKVVKLLRSGALTLSTPEKAVSRMMVLIDGLTPQQSGVFLSADGQSLPCQTEENIST
jgi:NAD(P)-dependent dehydrogenase (short-subunit alcohol dehydrogenase family)